MHPRLLTWNSTTSFSTEAQTIRTYRRCQGGASAARQASSGAQRHAGREPAGRSLEPVRVPCNPGLLSGATAFRQVLRRRRFARRSCCWPRGFVPSSCGEPKSRWRSNCQRRLSRRSSASSKTAARALRRAARPPSAHPARKAAPGRHQKLHVLEALLRLRQAACHPALVDAKR